MKNPSQKHGFTLLETLIAIAILTIAVGAALGVAQKALMSSAFSKNQTTAFFLATEGLELVRDIRDNVSLYNETNTAIDWLKPFKSSSVCNVSTGALSDSCLFDINPTADLSISATGDIGSSALQKCDETANKNCLLNIVNNSGEIYYSSLTAGPSSFFDRQITITEKCYSDWDGVTPTDCSTSVGKKEAIVTSTVHWLDESFSISETLTNWQ